MDRRSTLRQDNARVHMNEAYEERAAIMEYEGGLSREEAERLAREAHQPRAAGWIEPPGDSSRETFAETARR